ncbi:hypothetical protein O181_029502 [Austropuccinia psidii MF-1]|uniref:Uncharacterized protein n=1 Tax=Austropuccinia psidii MF-1 TaxID=1389203 RepID=A0A9Q3CTX6_9BASI|nr:hypothetical protein [Austropuccinia psidii MF-1]
MLTVAPPPIQPINSHHLLHNSSNTNPTNWHPPTFHNTHHPHSNPTPPAPLVHVRCDYETDDNITINQQYCVCSYEI